MGFSVEDIVKAATVAENCMYRTVIVIKPEGVSVMMVGGGFSITKILEWSVIEHSKANVLQETIRACETTIMMEVRAKMKANNVES